ncbi:hypothetical protein AWC38_SpisGene394 [Stylophora pistillata]|uniref:OTU domain-containing protein n=1 Tax=Stylophora pistillata TaxID=50429 RepID=A0A2B4T2A7_STYPI|nr:hypothetical protein AWC38_SpisGene394 [Stylophora pistillata]
MPPRKLAHSYQSNTQRKKRAHSDQSNTQRTTRAHSDESNTQRRAKRTRGSNLSEVSPDVAVAAQTRSNDHNQSLIAVDLRALSTSITTTISQAIQQALGTGGTHSTDPQDPRAPSILPVESDGERSSSGAIQGEIAAITQGTQPQSSPRRPFSSIAIALGSRVNPKIKAKIWDDEYVDFGGLLSLSPTIDRYSRSLTPSRIFAREFGLIFRENDDLGEQRLRSTPSERQKEQDLDGFLRKWKSVPETISDVCSEVVSESILKAAIGNDEALTTFSRCNCNKSLSVSDLTLLTNIPAGLTMFDAQDSENEGDESDPTIAEHDRSLSRNLAGFNLKVDKVARDGDCAFRGVAPMLRPICNPEQPEILNHLKSVGLCKSEDEDTITMRQLFVEEIKKFDRNF